MSQSTSVLVPCRIGWKSFVVCYTRDLGWLISATWWCQKFRENPHLLSRIVEKLNLYVGSVQDWRFLWLGVSACCSQMILLFLLYNCAVYVGIIYNIYFYMTPPWMKMQRLRYSFPPYQSTYLKLILTSEVPPAAAWKNITREIEILVCLFNAWRESELDQTLVKNHKSSISCKHDKQ